ncbi:FGGY-family carbohydrate kinase [Phytoactinopolyspora mesophila]|uniref:Sugar kinase n=1 Tax=Phytoactinopolyspora mesophila TaxID=2650750 RepID=A0A7K3M489_9ACTN|nr:FGGY-family carbohydrate kinase [Phytoactinopolyspora mesophila]NDL58040.1 sugar kinase [Phytoactinopolyspora mesophila]
MDELLLGIDMGTGSSKGVLSTPDGRIVATAARSHAMSLPRPGWAEVDAEAVWWNDVTSLARELVGRSSGARIAGVCVSGVGPCLVLCTADVQPVRPAILYGIDTRATAEIEGLTDRFGADEVLRRCGKALSSQAVGPKLLWARRNEPASWQRTARWYSSSSFITARLSGEYVLDHLTASQCDPMYDIHARDWNREWADEVAGGLPLPQLAWSGEVVGKVTGRAAAETGLAEGTPVSAGTVDAWAEAFSAGVREPGDLMVMYGSTAFFVGLLTEPRADPVLWTTAGVEPGTYTLAAGMATSGSLTGWLQELVGGVAYEQLVEEASQVPPGSEGLMMLPYFAGERTPHFDSRARGVVAGLSLRHGRGHLFRAAYEGIAFGTRQILELLDDDGPPARLIAVGGGTQSPLWTQIVSDVSGREQAIPKETIGASYGDALLAGIGVGLLEPGTNWSRISHTVTPDDSTRDVYDSLYETYLELYPATRPHVHQLAQLQEQTLPS